MESLVKSFVIGSSAFITIPYLVHASKLSKNVWNFNFKEYSVVMPLYFGFMTILANIIRKEFNISLFISIIIIAVISMMFTATMIKTFKHNILIVYPEEWDIYWSKFILAYIFTYSIIFLLEKYLS